MTSAPPHPKSLTYQPEEMTCVKRCNGFLRRHRPTRTNPSAFYVAQASHLWWLRSSGRSRPAALLGPLSTRGHRHLWSRPTDPACPPHTCALLKPVINGVFQNCILCRARAKALCEEAAIRGMISRPATFRDQNTGMSSQSSPGQGNNSVGERVVSLRIPYPEIETWPNTIRPLTHPATTPTNRARATRPIYTAPHRPLKSAAAPQWPSLLAGSLSGLSSCISCSAALAAMVRLQRPVALQIIPPTSLSIQAQAQQTLLQRLTRWHPHLQQSLSQHQHRSKQHLNQPRLTDTDSHNHIDNPIKAGRLTTPGFGMSRLLAGPRKARPCCC